MNGFMAKRLFRSALVGAAFSQAAFAQTSTASATIPSDGGTVKAGDIIVWRVDRPITVISAPGSNSGTATTARAQASLSDEDLAKLGLALSWIQTNAANSTAAAAAMKAADTQKTTDQTLANRLGASAADKAKAIQSAAAADISDAAAVQAKSDLAAANAHFLSLATNASSLAPSGSSSSTAGGIAATPSNAELSKLAAAVTWIQTSTANLRAAAATMTAADATKVADQAAAAAAGATAADKSKAAQSSAAADIADAAASQAAADLAAAQLYYANITAKPATSAQSVCFPKDTRLEITSVVAASSSSGGSTSSGASSSAQGSGAASSASTVTASNTQLVTGHFPDSERLFHPYHNNSELKHVGDNSPPTHQQAIAESHCEAIGQKVAVLDSSYEFTSDQLTAMDYKRMGFTWGGLVIPYKFYFTDKSIKTNSSVVGFAGYEGWFPGVSLSTVIAAGGGAASSTSSTTVATYTVAVGFIMAFGQSNTLKAGLMFGRDYQGNASTFAYENKTWMALSIGAGF
jgi:hypothetical protein